MISMIPMIPMIPRTPDVPCAMKSLERCTTTAPICPLHLASCQVLLTNDRTAFVDPNDGRGLSYESVVQIGPKGALGLAWFHHLWMTEYDWTGLALCYMKLDSNTQTYLDTYSKLLESVGFLADQPLWDEGSVQCGTGWSYWAESWTPLDLIAIIY
jgi:hypothetical protein